MLEQITTDKPVIAIMGAKGGVGKTSITARMAELIAETKNNVLIIDFDIESAGSTNFHSERTKIVLPPVKTVYDHLSPYSKPSASEATSTDERLWRVTPTYLQEKELGEVYLIPALPPGATGGWEVVGDIDSKKRNETLRKETDKIIQRAEMAEHNISCVIIDCGAGVNPIFSAAFDRARYAFVVATPDPICFNNIDPIRREHMARFSQTNIRKMQIIVNRLATEEQVKEAMMARWTIFRPAGFIPEDPDFQEGYFLGAVYFELGYDDFSIAVRDILAKTMQGMDASLVPDEIDVWITPWWRVIVANQLPRRELSKLSFKIKTFLTYMITIVALAVSFATGYYYLKTQGGTLAHTEVAVIQVDSESEAQEILAKINEGESFSELAKQYSTDRTTGARGGLLKETVGKKDELPSFGSLNGLAEALEKTKIGSVYDKPLSKNNKFYIVKPLARYFAPTRKRLLFALGCIAAIVCSGVSIIWFWIERKKRKLLAEVDKKGGDKRFLSDLLHRSTDKKEVEWFKRLAEQEIKRQRERDLSRYRLQEND